MRSNDAIRRRMRSAIAIAFAACLLVIASGSRLPWFEPLAPHPHHTVSAATPDEFAVSSDHPHVEDGSPVAPEAFATAVLPRVSAALVAFGLVAAAMILAGSLAQAVPPTMRGPPRSATLFLTGRHRVTRLCIARR